MKALFISPNKTEPDIELESLTVDTNTGQHTILTEHAGFIGFFRVSNLRAILTSKPGSPAVLDRWAAYGFAHVIDGDVRVVALQFSDSAEAVNAFADAVDLAAESGYRADAAIVDRKHRVPG